MLQTWLPRCGPHLKTLRDDDASSSKHGPPSVDELIFPVLLNLGGVLSKAERVISVAASGHALIRHLL